MERKELDNLQWLQQNPRLYVTGTAIITFLVTLVFCLFFTNPWQPQQESIAFFHDSDSDVAADQQMPDTQQADDTSQTEQPTPSAGEKQPAAAPLPAKSIVPDSGDTATEHQPEQSTAKQSEVNHSEQIAQAEQDAPSSAAQPNPVTEQPLQPVTQNPTQLNGFTAPCQGQLLYAYGVGYDPIYEDYRFHDGLCYRADGEVVTAATAGTVQSIVLEQQPQIIVQFGAHTIHYSGLQTCEVQTGDTLTAGQPLGTAGAYFYITAYR